MKIDAIPLSVRLKVTEALQQSVQKDKRLGTAEVISKVAPLLDPLKLSPSDADALITTIVAGFKDGSVVDPEVHKLFGAASASFQLGNAGDSGRLNVLLGEAAEKFHHGDTAGALGQLESARLLAPDGAQKDLIAKAAEAAKKAVESYRTSDRIVSSYNARIDQYDMTLGFEAQAAAELGQQKNRESNPYVAQGNTSLAQAKDLLAMAQKMSA
jgi:hypothetical protein